MGAPSSACGYGSRSARPPPSSRGYSSSSSGGWRHRLRGRPWASERSMPSWARSSPASPPSSMTRHPHRRGRGRR
eukprot:10714073-Lingulodinium_polyedra.AAC.1